MCLGRKINDFKFRHMEHISGGRRGDAGKQGLTIYNINMKLLSSDGNEILLKYSNHICLDILTINATRRQKEVTVIDGSQIFLREANKRVHRVDFLLCVQRQ